jgi:hypothetical protein
VAGVLLKHHDANHQHTPVLKLACFQKHLASDWPAGCRSQGACCGFRPDSGARAVGFESGLIAASIRISESSCASSFLGRLLLAREERVNGHSGWCLLSGINRRSLTSAMDPIQCRREGIVAAGDLGRGTKQPNPEQP